MKRLPAHHGPCKQEPLLWFALINSTIIARYKTIKHLNRLSVNSNNLTQVRFIYLLLENLNLFFIFSAE